MDANGSKRIIYIVDRLNEVTKDIGLPIPKIMLEWRAHPHIVINLSTMEATIVLPDSVMDESFARASDYIVHEYAHLIHSCKRCKECMHCNQFWYTKQQLDLRMGILR